MLTVVRVRTSNVVIGNLTSVAPVGTTTEAGTLAAPGRLLVSMTTTPPAGAGAVNRTVPLALLPPTSAEGFTAKEASEIVAGGVVGAGVTVNVVVFVAPP